MDDCKMSDYLFSKVKKKLYQMIVSGVSIKTCLACIYDLYQDYRISEEQETELYYIADPKEEFNEVSEYYHNYDGDNPLRCCL